MGEFFRGWRRKTGVVTLVMALVFMGGWVRSQSRRDLFHCPSSKYTSGKRFVVEENSFISSGQVICWLTHHTETDDEDDFKTIEEFMDYLGAPTQVSWGASSELAKFNDPVAISKRFWRLFGFAFCLYRLSDRDWETYLLIPYWSITIPLTALSAYLLLSKPHKSTSMKISEPIPDEGA